MHPIIAALTFIFSPSDDWLLRRAYELALNPVEVQKIAQSYDRMTQQYPSLTTDENGVVASGDVPTLVVWSEILQKNGHFEEAQNLRRSLLKNKTISPNLADDLNLRLGEMALLDGKIDEAEKYFLLVETNQGARVLDAKTNLLIVALAKENETRVAMLSDEIKTALGESIQTSHAIFPLGLAAYAQKNFAEAEEILSLLDSDSKAQYFLGLTYRQLGRPLEALAQWQKIQQTNPHSEWNELSQFQVAETYFQQGDDTLSQTACEKALAFNPKLSKEFIFRLASLDMKHGNYEKALARLSGKPLEGALAERATVIAAESLVKLGRAGDMFKAIAKTLPKNATPVSVYQSAWANAFDLNYDKAFTIAERGLENFYDPEVTPRLLLLQAMAYEHLDLRAEAMATYQTIVDRFPSAEAAAQGTEWLARNYMRLGRHKEVVTHVSALWERLTVSARRSHPDAAFWLAEAHVKLGRFEDATTYYTDFLAMAKPQNKLWPHAQFQEAMVLAKLNQTPAAVAQLSEFVKTAERLQKPEWVELAHVQQGNIYFNIKQFENAVAAYRASTDTPKAKFYEGLALYRMDYFSDAVDTWGKLAAAYPTDSYAEHALFKSGRTLFEIGKATDAVATFASYMEKYPANPRVKEALLQSAHALYNIGGYNEAAPFYSQYLAKYKTTEDLVAVTPYLAACYAKTNKTLDEAEALLKGLPPTDVLANLRWDAGAKEYNEKKYDSANAIFSRLLADTPTDPNSSEANFFRAESLFMANLWNEAEGSFNNYLNMESEDKLKHAPTALFHKGVSIFQQNKLLLAAQSFKTLVEKYPSDALANDAKVNLYLCYNNIGDFEIRDQLKATYGEPTVLPASSEPSSPQEQQKPEKVNGKQRPYLVEKDKLRYMKQEKKENVADSRTGQ